MRTERASRLGDFGATAGAVPRRWGITGLDTVFQALQALSGVERRATDHDHVLSRAEIRGPTASVGFRRGGGSYPLVTACVERSGRLRHGALPCPGSA